MKTILFIHGGKVEKESPSQRFKLRLDWAIDYFNKHNEDEEIIFFISGRWTNVTDNVTLTEAEVGKRYILGRISDVKIRKEDISVETIGNYAFSSPLIEALKPSKVIIFISDIMENRVRYMASKIFSDKFQYEFNFIQDELSGNIELIEREVKALKMFRKLLDNIENGNDSKIRDTLLYKTPYYFKGIIEDKVFFDEYWEGGFEDFIAKRLIRHSQG